MSADFADNLAKRALEGRRLDDIPVIDIHCHLGSYIQAQLFNYNAADMVACMDAIGVDVACISGFPSISSDYRLGNDMVGDAVRDYPDRFVGYATINPNYLDTVVPELERCFDKLKMKGLKFHPTSHGYPLDGAAYGIALEFANDHGAFVLSHTWETPQILREFAKRYPRVRFIAAHQAAIAGIVPTNYDFTGVIRDMPNVYGDVASSLAPMGGFEAMVKTVGARKVLFGSDAPLLDMAYQIGRVLFADIGEDEKMLILGQNAAEVIG